jgi:hypothetical protein
MAQSTWHLERYEKAATKASWSGDFTDFPQVLEFATSVLGSGKGESVRFSRSFGWNVIDLTMPVSGWPRRGPY